ncbi:MAG TPA: 50S ribosomal protein L15 [bacterium]|nr:50S ribosomal protein L15 [bacterium]
MVELWNLKNSPGATKRRKIVGRGVGSKHGKTSTRGHKGQKARTGGRIRPGFEGGQMPLYRRLPKRGFNNPFKKEFAVVNVQDLNGMKDGTTVTVDLLHEKKLVKNVRDGVKILGNGDLKKKLTVVANTFSASAKKKIEDLGGQCQIAPKAKTSAASA